MKRLRSGGIMVLALVIIMVVGGTAFGFRCGNRVVETGDTTFEVLMECGPPDLIEVLDSYCYGASYFPGQGAPYRDPGIPPRLIKECQNRERWVYNPGPHELVRYLIFEDGVLERINVGEYGYPTR